MFVALIFRFALFFLASPTTSSSLEGNEKANIFRAETPTSRFLLPSSIRILIRRACFRVPPRFSFHSRQELFFFFSPSSLSRARFT